MSGSFVGQIQRLVGKAVPWFLRRKNVGRFLESVAMTFDTIAESTAQGLALSQPLRCDASALPIIARDRGLRLYASEPTSSQRYRLSQHLQLRRQFGSHAGQMRNVQPFFLSHASIPRMRIVHQSGDGLSATWHTLEPDGTYSWSRKTPSNWNWDGQAAQWSRYWLIIYTDELGLPAQPEWDEGQLWDGGSVWGGLFNEAEIADIVGGILEARAPHTKLCGVIFAPDPATFDPTASVVVDPDGWSNLPAGNWDFVVDPITGQPTRQVGAVFAYEQT